MTNLTATELLARYEAGERDFAGVVLQDENLSGAILSGINLKGASLFDVSLSNAYLPECNFSNANLVGLNLMNATLCFSNFEGACLKSINGNGANFGQANLKGADLTMAEFVDACLKDAKLSETKPTFRSHAYWGELLSQKAETKEQQILACFVAGGHRFNLCWSNFWEWEHPLEDWAIEAITTFKLNFENCPSIASRLKDAAEQAASSVNGFTN